MAVRPPHSIPVSEFQYGGDEDFDEWIQSFEETCFAASHPVDEDAKYKIFLECSGLGTVQAEDQGRLPGGEGRNEEVASGPS
jgi:hypothetical protein